MGLPSSTHWTPPKSAEPHILRWVFFAPIGSMVPTTWDNATLMGSSVMFGRRWTSFGITRMLSLRGLFIGFFTLVISASSLHLHAANSLFANINHFILRDEQGGRHMWWHLRWERCLRMPIGKPLSTVLRRGTMETRTTQKRNSPVPAVTGWMMGRLEVQLMISEECDASCLCFCLLWIPFENKQSHLMQSQKNCP